MTNFVPLMYNLFPRHLRTIDEWSGRIDAVREMGFTALFVNPFHEPGGSGSLYSIKDYYRLNPLFLGKGKDPADFAPLRKFVAACGNAGLQPVMDLVINHTATDSPLVNEHPAWYKRDAEGMVESPFAIDPGNPGKVTVWGDLATIDNESSSDRESLWNYWDSIVAFYQEIGFHGFRCDAAYQVPCDLWRWLIERARKRRGGATFYAETLGCRLDQVEALRPAGFDYLFNSVKWWNYDGDWAIEQHSAHRSIAPSLGFPESHDTERLASTPPGTEAVQKARYAFSALFSKGLLMPMGYEWGSTTPMNVVHGKPSDLDKPKWDMSGWIGAMNRLKLSLPVLCEEGQWRALCAYDQPFLWLEKSSTEGEKPAYVCINKNATSSVTVDASQVPDEVRRCAKALPLTAYPIADAGMPEALSLDPAEIVLFTP